MKQFTSLQTANILGVTTRTLQRWRRLGKFIPNLKTIGGHSRYSQEQIEKTLGHNIMTNDKVDLQDLLS